MKFRKLLATGLAAVTLLGTAVTTVSAARMQLTRKSYVYNAKGKKTKLFYRKGKTIKTLGTIKINGKKYYRIGKNKYISIKNLKKFKHRPVSEQEPQEEPQELIPVSDDWSPDPTQKAIEEHNREMKEKANQFGDWIKNGQNEN